MLALLQLLLPERATKQRVAVLIHSVGEVLTIHAVTGSLSALKLSVFVKPRFLHHHLTSTSALPTTVLRRQWLTWIKGNRGPALETDLNSKRAHHDISYSRHFRGLST